MTAYEQRPAAGGPPPRPAESHVSAVPQEARAYQGLRAGIVSRLIANTIDGGVLVVMLGALYVTGAAGRFLLNPAAFTFPAPRFGAVLFLGMVLLAGYLALSWVATGRTYGDHVLGLRVVDERGDRLGYLRALLRAVACVVFPLGLFWTAVSSVNRSLQDIVLRTSVVYDWEQRPLPGSTSRRGS